MKKEPTKEQKKKFTKGFFWGKVEHRFESYTTYVLLLGVIAQIVGLVYKKWSWLFVSTVCFAFAFFFRLVAGISHRIEKYYMDKLRFGKWKR